MTEEVASLRRSCFRVPTPPGTVKKHTQLPKGARNKLNEGCKYVVLKHDFDEVSPGIADKGITHVRVKPACDYTFSIKRLFSERELADWGAALFLIDNMLDRHRTDFAAGASLLELGCGLGLPGMVCAAVGAEVLLTDRPDKEDRHHNLMETLEENVASNFMGPSNKPPGGGTGRVGAYEFEWSEEGAKKLVSDHGHFDFVIASDCVYQPVYGTSWKELAACFNILCGPATQCYLAFQRRTQDQVDGFLELLKTSYHFLTEKHEIEFRVPTGPAMIEMHSLRRMRNTEQFHIDVSVKEAEQELIDVWRTPTRTTLFNR